MYIDQLNGGNVYLLVKFFVKLQRSVLNFCYLTFFLLGKNTFYNNEYGYGARMRGNVLRIIYFFYFS